MESIIREFSIPVIRDQAFDKFVKELNHWWPPQYTWSQDKLREIRMDGKKDGLCTEIGPYGFRCDWGRITEYVENKKITLKWQIGPSREPVPDPKRASDIEIVFKKNGQATNVKFEHANFQNHGPDAQTYRELMAGPQGWDFILKAFRQYCEG